MEAFLCLAMLIFEEEMTLKHTCSPCGLCYTPATQTPPSGWPACEGFYPREECCWSCSRPTQRTTWATSGQADNLRGEGKADITSVCRISQKSRLVFNSGEYAVPVWASSGDVGGVRVTEDMAGSLWAAWPCWAPHRLPEVLAEPWGTTAGRSDRGRSTRQEGYTILTPAATK